MVRLTAARMMTGVLLLVLSGPLYTQDHSSPSQLPLTFTGGVDTAWVRHYASNMVLSNSRAVAVVADTAGNIYLTGASEGTFTHDDYVTVKFDSLGNRQWIARYDGPENNDDVPVAMALDQEGNICVTGYSYGTDTGRCFATVKYNANGIQQWVARYGGNRHYPTAMAVDESGFIYVTGYRAIVIDSKDGYSINEGLTVVYNPDGSQRWSASYSGIRNDVTLYAIAFDQIGNVHVGGMSEAGYELVKYSPAGRQQWYTLHPYLASKSSSSIAVDTLGNVFITGTGSADYITVKYNSSGVKQWEAIYEGLDLGYGDRATAVCVDDSGNVYVTGTSGDFSYSVNFATLRYDPDGIQQWEARLDSIGRYYYGHTATIALDDSGNIYVSGVEYTNYPVVKYNRAGVQQWVAARSDSIAAAADMFVDASGNVYTIGIRHKFPYTAGFSAVKYNSAGEEQLVLRYDGSGISRDEVRAMEIDDAGYIYVAGISQGTGTASDFATLKYSEDGSQLWAARYNGAANGDDLLEAMAVDAAGNVYVTGGSSDSSGYLDYATVKYNTEGVEQWAAVYHGTGSPLYGYDDIPRDIGVDDSGNVYVTGYTSSYDTNSRDYATIKYNAQGVEQWIRYYNGPTWLTDEAVALALDDSGYIYVTGTSESDYLTIKYDPEGTSQWLLRYNSDNDHAKGIRVDTLNNVYVTGFSDGDFTRLKIDENGSLLRVHRYSGDFSSRSSDHTTDKFGNACVNGYLSDNSYLVTHKYRDSGAFQWEARYLGSSFSTDYHHYVQSAVSIDDWGNVYSAGYSRQSRDDPVGLITIKYDSDGAEQWITRLEGLAFYGKRACVSAVDDSGYVYVAGTVASRSLSKQYWYTFILMKYLQLPPASVSDIASTLPNRYHLHQNVPNPFNPVSTIRYELPLGSLVSLTIYDLMGREVSCLKEGYQQPGYYEVQWAGRDRYGREVPSGIYFTRLLTPQFSKSIKMLLLK